MATIGLFTLIYVILRTVLDKVIPGNIRLPNLVDRVGGGAIGLVAAVFTTGVIALAAQMMPFGPAVGGYTRYETEERPEVTIPSSRSGGQQRTADVNTQLTEDTFVAEKKKSLLLPVDDLVLGFVNMVSG